MLSSISKYIHSSGLFGGEDTALLDVSHAIVHRLIHANMLIDN